MVKQTSTTILDTAHLCRSCFSKTVGIWKELR